MITPAQMLTWAAELPATPERDALVAGLAAHLTDIPLEVALGWKPGQGQRSAETLARIERRDAAIRDAAGALFPTAWSPSRQAVALEALLRRKGACPPAGIDPHDARRHSGVIIAAGQVPSARTIRRALATKPPAFRGQLSLSPSPKIEDRR